ncbi:MAG: hypothetical protein LBK63_06820 [Treponema sp.]|jgi:hypothetical protein|nr:hypothetical protein [Treponema sp.]
MSLSTIDWNTNCDLGVGDKTQPAAAPSLRKASAYRYNGAFYPTFFKNYGSGMVTFEGRSLKWDNSRLTLDDVLLRDFSGSFFVSAPTQKGKYEHVAVRNESGTATLLGVNITSNVTAEIDCFNAKDDGTFDLSGDPDRVITVAINDLQGRTGVYLVHNSYDVLLKSPTAFAINTAVHGISLSDDLYAAKFDDGTYFLCEQYNDNKVVDVPVYGRSMIIEGAESVYIAGSWAESHYAPDGTEDGVTAYFLHDKISHKAALVGDAISYTRLFNSSDWTATFYAISTGGTEYTYSETFFPGDNILFTYDTDETIGAYLWRRADGISQLESSLLDGRIIPATDYGRTNVGDADTPIFASALSTLFNRSRIDPMTGKAAVIWSRGRPFAASYNTVLVAPAAQVEKCDIVNIAGNTYFVINDSYVVAVGINVPKNIELISGDLYRINVADAHNLLQITKNDAVWYPGAVDWNNRIQPTQVLAINSSSYQVDIADASICSWNSAYGANYEADGVRSTSLLVGSPSMTSYSQSNQKLKTDSTLFWSEVARTYPLDYYWRRTGANSVDVTPLYVSTDFRTVRAVLNGLAYPEPESATIALPFPVNADYSRAYANVVSVNWGEFGWITITRGKLVLASYFLAASLGENESLFYLAGSYYSYDGDAIWRLYQENGVIQSYFPSARVSGLLFCGASTQAAYFWSDIDHVLYTYSGDDTITASLSCTQLGKLVLAGYCQSDDTISLCFEESYVAIRHGLISTYDFIVDGITITAIGTMIRQNGEWLSARPYKEQNPEEGFVYPVVLETNILGSSDDLTTVDLIRLGVRAAPRPRDLRIAHTLHNRKIKKEFARIPEFLQDDMAVFSVNPKAVNNLGVVFWVSCESAIFLLDYEITEQATVANKAGRISV